MDESQNQENNQQPNQEPTSSLPEKPKFASHQILFIGILILLIVILLSLSTYFLTQKRNTATLIPTPQPTATATSPTPTGVGANWKTYTNKKYGFEFQYPPKFGTVKEDNSYYRFDNNDSFQLYLSGGQRYKQQNPSQVNENCGTLKNSFLYCRYLKSNDDKWILITEQHSFSNIPFAINALTDALPKSNDPNYSNFLNFMLKLPELAKVPYDERIKLTKNDLLSETRQKIDDFDQILSTFKFLDESGVKPTTSPISLAGLPEPVQIAIKDLATKLSIAPEKIAVVEMKKVDWPDTSLGCPKEGMFYAQVITAGYRVILLHDKKTYRYHTDQAQKAVQCDNTQ